MKNQAVFILAMVMVVFGFHIGQVKAADITFTEDGVIREPNVYDYVYILNDATVDMYGGTALGVRIYDEGTFNMYGGTVHIGVRVYDESTFNLRDGTLDTIGALDSGTVNVTGGSLRRLSTYLSGLVNIYNVEVINGLVVTHDLSVVNIYGGNISESNIWNFPDSEVNIFGGNITFTLAWDSDPNSVFIHGYDFNYDPNSRVFTGSLAYVGQITITDIWPSSHENLNLVLPEPVNIVAAKIKQIIIEETEMLEAIDEMLDEEQAQYDVLEELLEAGNYADLSKADITKAKQKTHSAILHQEQSKEALEKSIEKLEDVLVALAWDPLADVLVEE